MKILNHGSMFNKYDDNKLFICERCGCIWIANINECMISSEQQIISSTSCIAYTTYEMYCPDCKTKTVSINKSKMKL